MHMFIVSSQNDADIQVVLKAKCEAAVNAIAYRENVSLMNRVNIR